MYKSIPQRSIIFSSFLFNAAFIAPALFDWCIFLFLIPLFHMIVNNPQKGGFKEGVMWGVLFFGIHFYPIALIILGKGYGPFRMVVWFILIGYSALTSGLWFKIAQKVTNSIQSTQLQPYGWIAITIGYYWFIYNGFLWFVGAWYGYCFMLPLIPLAQHPEWLAALSYVSMYWLVLLLVSGQMGIAVWLVRGCKRGATMGACMVVIFMSGWFKPLSTPVPDYVYLMAYSKPPAATLSHPLDRAQAINTQLNEIIEERPFIRWIFLPEATYEFCLNTMPDIVSLLTDIPRSENVGILIGSHKEVNGIYHNTLYFLTDSHIIDTYDKTILMPFGEYTPWPWKHWTVLKKLLIKNNKEFKAQKINQARFFLDPNFSVTPAICSDVFLNKGELLSQNPDPVLWVVNDNWFAGNFMQHLMSLYAKFQAISQSRDYIYISHYQGTWISRLGISVDL